ncbi:MAG: Trk system potassium transporter TrkA [Ruminococcaceae bacterium]|nr:Trk system potassium transporter TrkA [Oscillospiraceae bacterium]
MNIIIVGCGKVGLELAERLSADGHAVTMMDTNANLMQKVLGPLDVQGVVGNGTSYRAQMEAGVPDADLLIAVTDIDETSLLSCLIARKAGDCQTIARVRSPEYFEEIRFIKEELGLSMAINPDQAAASAIARLIQIPSAMEVDSFAKGRVNLVRFQLPEDSPYVGLSLMKISEKIGTKLLIPMIERGEEVIIPDGRQVIENGDALWIVANLATISKIFKAFGVKTRAIKNVMIAGGGRVSLYLAQALTRAHIRVKMIESDEAKCEQLSDLLPEVEIVCGDATDEMLLHEEAIEEMDAFVSLTSIDEENILLSMYAQKVSKAKIVTKISRITFEEVINELPIGSVVCPRAITTERILRYVRSMENASGSNVETLYYLAKGRAEALEFKVKDSAHIRDIVGIPLMELNLKSNLLICCINRNGKIITPSGGDCLQIGDTVIVVTTHKGLSDLTDILA